MNKLLLALACCSLFACGTESSTTSVTSGGASNTDGSSNQADINMAAKSSGGSVTASYDANAAEYVIDGDKTTSLYWSGNITGDYLTVDLGKSVSASSIAVYTNDTSFFFKEPLKNNRSLLRRNNMVEYDGPIW